MILDNLISFNTEKGGEKGETCEIFFRYIFQLNETDSFYDFYSIEFMIIKYEECEVPRGAYILFMSCRNVFRKQNYDCVLLLNLILLNQ